ncbi:phage tail terminator-like protein [Aquabacterium sp.]|uniref:phage tail terminator-like protein n=1 Tax=Aquabacterium sp. TaxID=1872578 RepID=UPI003D6C903F
MEKGAQVKFGPIQRLLDQHLQSIADLPTLQTENTKINPTNGVAWCRSTLIPSESLNVGLGPNGLIQQQGLFQIDLFYPKDYGIDASADMADKVMAAFIRGTELIDSDGLVVQVINSWRSTATVSGTTRKVPVFVAWRCFVK